MLRLGRSPLHCSILYRFAGTNRLRACFVSSIAGQIQRDVINERGSKKDCIQTLNVNHRAMSSNDSRSFSSIPSMNSGEARKSIQDIISRLSNMESSNQSEMVQTLKETNQWLQSVIFSV